MLTDTAIFLWGLAGFLSFEVWTAAYGSQDPKNRYRRLSFWVTRLLLCGVAGLVTLAIIRSLNPSESKIRLMAMALGFCMPSLPNLMTQVLSSMKVGMQHLWDIDISKILNPTPESGGLQE